MSEGYKVGASGLADLLKLFEDDITISDITASRILGEISASIVKKRMELEMTQQEFAAYMNVSQGMVSKWEGGDYNFSIRNLADITEKLEMELSVRMHAYGSNVQLQHLKNSDISYVVSDQRKFTAKACSVVQYKSREQKTESEGKCRVYNFYERIEM